MNNKPNQNKSSFSYGKMIRKAGLVTMIPMLFVAGPIAGYFIGSWIDQKFSIDPWGKTIFPLLGFAAGLKESIAIIKRSSKEYDEE